MEENPPNSASRLSPSERCWRYLGNYVYVRPRKFFCRLLTLQLSDRGVKMLGKPSAGGLDWCGEPESANGASGCLHQWREAWDCVGDTGNGKEVSLFPLLFYSFSLTFEMVYVRLLSLTKKQPVRYPPTHMITSLRHCFDRRSLFPKALLGQVSGRHAVGLATAGAAFKRGTRASSLSDSLPRRAAVFTRGHRAFRVDGDLRCALG